MGLIRRWLWIVLMRSSGQWIIEEASSFKKSLPIKNGLHFKKTELQKKVFPNLEWMVLEAFFFPLLENFLLHFPRVFRKGTPTLLIHFSSIIPIRSSAFLNLNNFAMHWKRFLSLSVSPPLWMRPRCSPILFSLMEPILSGGRMIRWSQDWVSRCLDCGALPWINPFTMLATREMSLSI